MKCDMYPNPLELEGQIKNIKERLSIFLSTDPVPVFIMNNVNGVLGFGMNLPMGTVKSRINVGEALEDMLQL